MNKSKLLICFSIIISLFIISSISAYSVTLSSNPSSLNIIAGNSQNIIVNYVIENTNGLSGSNGVSVSGTPLFSSYSGTSISYGANTTTSGNITITISVPSGTVTGDYINSISMSGVSVNIPIHVTATNDCQINPSLGSYTQVVQSGSKIAIPKITFNPTNCLGSIVYDASHMYIEGGIVISGLQKPVAISSIVSDGINLNVDTESLSSQTYNTKLKVNAFSKNFEIPITIIVTGSSGVTGNLSENSVPTCSLSASTLSINGTYSMICSAVTDIVIRPRVDPEYIIGTGLDSSPSQYKWNFRAIKFGKTTIYGDFYYGDSPLGKSFSQEVAINVLGFGGDGSILNVSFFQGGIRKNINSVSPGETIFTVLDSYGNLVSSYQIIINGVIMENNTIYLESDKIYDLRITSPGYSDLVVPNFKTNENKIDILISPSQSTYNVGDLINITTDINATILVNDIIIVGSSYIISYGGNLTIKAVKDGYTPTNKTISVNTPVNVLAVTPDYESWRVGDMVTMKLDKIVSWNVLMDGISIASDSGDNVNFDIDSIGTYQVKSGEYVIVNKTVTKKGWFSFLKNKWFWIILSLIIIIACLVFYFRNKSSSIDSGYAFQTQVR